MTRFLRLTSPVLALLGLALPTPIQAGPLIAANGIRVRVFPYADIPKHVLEGAFAESKRVFRRAGVQTTWIACETKRVTENSRQCTAKPTAVDIIVRITSMHGPHAAGHNPFGVAFVPRADRPGVHASVFYDRVKEHSGRWQAPAALLLGHLIAHEVGHLLLGNNSHSRSGIMQARWNRNTTDKAYRATLLFTARQEPRIRDQVNRRIALVNGRGRTPGTVLSKAESRRSMRTADHEPLSSEEGGPQPR